MALQPCWECGKEISSSAAACPACGAPPEAPAHKPPDADPTTAPKGGCSRAFVFTVLGLLGVGGLIMCGAYHLLDSASENTDGAAARLVAAAVSEPQEIADEVTVVPEDQYYALKFQLTRVADVLIELDVQHGPAIDAWVMTSEQFHRFRVGVRSRRMSRVSFVEGMSCAGVRQKTMEGELLTGKYILVIDNTNFGSTRPPSKMRNDRATVRMKVTVK